MTQALPPHDDDKQALPAPNVRGESLGTRLIRQRRNQCMFESRGYSDGSPTPNTHLTTLIVLPQRSDFTVMRDLNHSKLTPCRLLAIATACSKVHQVNILVICSPSKANEDSQRNSDSEERLVIVYQLAVQCKAQRWYESQSRQLKNEGEKIFPCFARTDRHYPHCLRQWPYRSKNASYGPVLAMIKSAIC